MAILGIIDDAVAPADQFLGDTIGMYQQRLTATLRNMENKIVQLASRLETTAEGVIKGPKWTAKQSLNIYSEMENLFTNNFGGLNQDYVEGFTDVRGTIEQMLAGINIPVSFTKVDTDLLRGLQTQTLNGLMAYGDQVKNEVTGYLQNAMVNGHKFTDLVNNIRGSVTGLEGVGGRSLAQYASVYAQDGLMNAYRTLQKKKADDAGVSRFIWYGNVKATSRPICCQYAGEILSKEELDELDLHDWEGKSDSVWKTLGGWNCRHHLVPVTDEYANEIEALEVDNEGKVPVQNWFKQHGMALPIVKMTVKNPVNYDRDLKALKMTAAQIARAAAKQADLEAQIAARVKQADLLKSQTIRPYKEVEGHFDDWIVVNGLAAKVSPEVGDFGVVEGNQLAKAVYEHSFGSKLDSITYSYQVKPFPVKATSPWSLEFNPLAMKPGEFAVKQQQIFNDWVNIEDKISFLNQGKQAYNNVLKTLDDVQMPVDWNVVDISKYGITNNFYNNLEGFNGALTKFHKQAVQNLQSAIDNFNVSAFEKTVTPWVNYWDTLRLYNQTVGDEQLGVLIKSYSPLMETVREVVNLPLASKVGKDEYAKAFMKVYDTNKEVFKLAELPKVAMPQNAPIASLKNIGKFVKADGSLIKVSDSIEATKKAIAKIDDELSWLEIAKDAVRPTTVKNLNDAVMYEMAGQQYDLFYSRGGDLTALLDTSKTVRVSAEAVKDAKIAFQEAYVAMYNGMKTDVDPAIQTLITKVKNKLADEVLVKDNIDVSGFVSQLKGLKKVEDIQKFVVTNFLDDEMKTVAFIEGLGTETGTANIQALRTMALIGPDESTRYRAFTKYVNLYDKKNPLKQSLKDLMQADDVQVVKKAIAELWTGPEGAGIVDDMINSAIINELGIEGTFEYGVVKIPTNRINATINQAVREIYDETQSFYKGKNTQFVKVYKGVKPTQSLERGVVLDHWQTQYNSASKEKFMGKTGIVENKAVPPELVFVSNESHPELFYKLKNDRDIYLLNEIPAPKSVAADMGEVANLTEDEAKLQLAKLKAAKKEAKFQAEVYDNVRKENYADTLKWQLEAPNKTVNFTKDFDHSAYELNGIQFKPAKAPKSFKLAKDKKILNEPDLGPGEWLDRTTGEIKSTRGYHQSVGVIVEEADGRMWIVEPEGHFGGYQNTFAKGVVEEGFTLQQTALKEAYEEMGLMVDVDGYLGDYQKTSSITRYYTAKRIGGDPSNAHWESYKVKLATVNDLKTSLLNNVIDKKVLDDYLEQKLAKDVIAKVSSEVSDPDTYTKLIAQVKGDIKEWIVKKQMNPEVSFEISSLNDLVGMQGNLQAFKKWGMGEWQQMAANELDEVNKLAGTIKDFTSGKMLTDDFVKSAGKIVGYKNKDELLESIKEIYAHLDTSVAAAATKEEAAQVAYWHLSRIKNDLYDLKLMDAQAAKKYDHLLQFADNFVSNADKAITKTDDAGILKLVGNIPPLRIPEVMTVEQTNWFNMVKYNYKKLQQLADKPKSAMFKETLTAFEDIFNPSVMKANFSVDLNLKTTQKILDDLVNVDKFVVGLKKQLSNPFKVKSAEMADDIKEFVTANRLKPSFPAAAESLAAKPAVQNIVLNAAAIDEKLTSTWLEFMDGVKDWEVYNESTQLFKKLNELDDAMVKLKLMIGPEAAKVYGKWERVDIGLQKMFDLAGTKRGEVNISILAKELDKIPLLNPAVSGAVKNPKELEIIDDGLMKIYNEFNKIVDPTKQLDSYMNLLNKGVAELANELGALGDEALSKKWSPFIDWVYKGNKFLKQETDVVKYSVLFEKLPKVEGVIKEVVKVDPVKVILGAAKMKDITPEAKKALTEIASALSRNVGVEEVPWDDVYFYKIEDAHNQILDMWNKAVKASDHFVSSVYYKDMKMLIDDMGDMSVEIDHLLGLNQSKAVSNVLGIYSKEINGLKHLVDSYGDYLDIGDVDTWDDVVYVSDFLYVFPKEKPFVAKGINMFTSKAAKVVDEAAKTVKETVVGQVENMQKFESKLDFVPNSQKGSNPGGDFINRDTKEKFYGKFYKNMEQGKSEMLANDIYDELGLGAPDTNVLSLMSPDGVKQEALVTKWIDGLERLDLSNKKQMDKYAEQLSKFHIASSLTENWDVVGLDYDNLLVKEGKIYIVDSGGVFKFRAQGASKAFNATADAFDSLLTTNQQAKSVFQKAFDDYTVKHADELIEWLNGLSDYKIANMFARSGLNDKTVLNNLIARRVDITERLGKLVKKPGALEKVMAKIKGKFEVATAKGIEAIEDVVKEIKKAGIVGKVIRWDREDIEDLNILVWTEKGVGKKVVTQFRFKLTQEGSAKLEKRFAIDKELVSRVVVDNKHMQQDVFWNDIVTAAKTVNHHVGDKQYNVGTIEKMLKHKMTLQSYVDQTENKALQQMGSYYLDLVNQIEGGYKAQSEIAAITQFIKPKEFEVIQVKAVEVMQAVRQFEARKEVFTFGKKTITNGEAKRMAGSIKNIDGAYLVEVDDVKVRVIPYKIGTYDNTDAPFALRGVVNVEIAEDMSPDAYRKAVDSLTRIGIDVAEPTDDYMELLYLRQGCYVNSWDQQKWFTSIWSSVKSDDQKIVELKNAIKKNVGIELPMEKTVAGHYPDWYNPLGKPGYAGNGWRYSYRWDLPVDVVEKELAKYSIVHYPSGHVTDIVESVLSNGGQFTSTTERLRMGISIKTGMSTDSDLNTGGASYLFTRITSKGGLSSRNTGFVFKIRNLSRMDAISYGNDIYGDVGGSRGLDVVRSYRAKTISELRSYANNSSNETIFKYGLSLVDEIENINVNRGDYDEVIASFKKYGYSKLPDGRRIEDVVKVI